MIYNTAKIIMIKFIILIYIDYNKVVDFGLVSLGPMGLWTPNNLAIMSRIRKQLSNSQGMYNT